MARSNLRVYPTADIASARMEAIALGHSMPSGRWARVRFGLSYEASCSNCKAYALVLPMLIGCWRSELSGPAIQTECPATK
jgi:hypothetical protein